MSNAVAMTAASSVKASSSFCAMPAWPAAAAIWVSPSAVMGMRVLMSSSSLPKALSPAASKSVTLRTSAMAVSKPMAILTGAATAMAGTTASIMLPRSSLRRADAAWALFSASSR